jgi:ketosteroid isomerase-like protein
VPAAVTGYFDALNAEDWDGFRALWVEDAAAHAVGARPRHGLDDVMDLYSKIFVNWSKHLDIPGRTLIDGDAVTVEVHFVGTTKEGREIEFDAVDVIDLEEGKLKSVTTWYDTARVLAMISGKA